MYIRMLLLLGLLVCSSFFLHVQAIHAPVFSGPYTTPLHHTTSEQNLRQAHWDMTIHSIYPKQKSWIFQTEVLKKKAAYQKRLWMQSNQDQSYSANKIAAINPQIGHHFKGNELKTWTPTDNSVAISNGGIIVSCINYGVEYYDTLGNAIVSNLTWDGFVSDTTLNQAKYDPRVLYDPKHDRFIIVLLHGFSSSTSKILVCFSKTNNPTDGWNIYQLSGNPYNDTSWSDFPTIGINDDELFINCNRFGNAPTYAWKETYIYQVGLAEGYNAQPLLYGLWNQLSAPDNTPGITLYPASDGQGHSLKHQMYFVMLRPDSGSHVYLYRLEGHLQNPNSTMQSFQYSIPPYSVCANAFQIDPTTGYVDSLSTASAWTQNAFKLGNIIHFCYSAAALGAWCGLHYGRIYLDSSFAATTVYQMPGTDLSYPAIASIGYDSLDAGVAMAYVYSDTSTTPSCGVVSIDHAMTWSSLQTVKQGDTSVNILFPPAYPIMPERWGDYTGIARKYNASQPQAWMAAAYGANTPPRKASYGTWIAQIITAESHIPSATSLFTPAPSLTLFPNPATSIFYMEFDNDQEGVVRIDIVAANGQLVKVLFEDYLRVSKNRISFNQSMLAKGAYIVRIHRQGKRLMTQKLLIH